MNIFSKMHKYFIIKVVSILFLNTGIFIVMYINFLYSYFSSRYAKKNLLIVMGISFEIYEHIHVY